MHKTMSRIVVLLLVVCLALGNVVPALAADDTGSAGAVTPTAETSPAATAEATAAPAAPPAADADGRNDRDSRNGGADRHADGRADRHAGTGSSHGGELSRRADGREGHERQDIRRQAGRR